MNLRDTREQTKQPNVKKKLGIIRRKYALSIIVFII